MRRHEFTTAHYLLGVFTVLALAAGCGSDSTSGNEASDSTSGNDVVDSCAPNGTQNSDGTCDCNECYTYSEELNACSLDFAAECDVPQMDCRKDKAGSSYFCQCPSTVTGPACETDINECVEKENPCPSHSVCENKDAGYMCPCDDGYHQKFMDTSCCSFKAEDGCPAFPEVEACVCEWNSSCCGGSSWHTKCSDYAETHCNLKCGNSGIICCPLNTSVVGDQCVCPDAFYELADGSCKNPGGCPPNSYLDGDSCKCLPDFWFTGDPSKGCVSSDEVCSDHSHFVLTGDGTATCECDTGFVKNFYKTQCVLPGEECPEDFKVGNLNDELFACCPPDSSVLITKNAGGEWHWDCSCHGGKSFDKPTGTCQ